MLSNMKNIAIVTGGNSGMGNATVAALADLGYISSIPDRLVILNCPRQSLNIKTKRLESI